MDIVEPRAGGGMPLWCVSPGVRCVTCRAGGTSGVFGQGGEFNYKPGKTGRQGDYLGGGVAWWSPVVARAAVVVGCRGRRGYTRGSTEKYRLIHDTRVRGREVKKGTGA